MYIKYMTRKRRKPVPAEAILALIFLLKALQIAGDRLFIRGGKP